MRQGELCILSAPYDSFKSSMSLELAYSICTGEPFLGKFEVVSPGPVYFFQLEVHPGVFDERVNNLNMNSNHQDLFWVDYDDMRFDAKLRNALELIIQTKQPKLIIFDPLANFWPTGMRENDNPMVNAVIRPLLHLRTTGTSFLMVHGDTKADSDGQAVRARGASDLLYRPDVRIFMDRLETTDGEPMDSARVTFRTRNKKRLPPFTVTFNSNQRLEYDGQKALPKAQLPQVQVRISTDNPRLERKGG